MIAHDRFTRRILDEMARISRPAPVSPAPTTATAAPQGGRWAAEPEHSTDTILENTGHTWDEWAELIDAGPGRQAGHTAIAAWVQAEHGVPGWWAQGVTVGYERITGLRLPGQMPDGTFSFSRSRVLSLPGSLLRDAVLDAGTRADLFPGIDTVLHSKPTSKALRFAVSGGGQPLGSLLFSADQLPDGRLRVTVTHDKLPTVEDGELWKLFWGDWLAAVAVAAEGDEAPGRIGLP